jgi:hypothetical protein
MPSRFFSSGGEASAGLGDGFAAGGGWNCWLGLDGGLSLS